MTTPTSPCYAIFHGIRTSARPGYVEMVHAPVEVDWYYVRGNAKELAVTLCGRATRFPIASFQGEWQVLEVEPT